MNEFDRALADHRAGRLEAAAAGYRRVLDSNPEHADACHLLGLTLHQRGENRLAVALVKQALLLNPRISNYHNSLGLALHGMGEMDAAIRAFQTSITIDPDNADAYNNLGMVHSTLRRYAEAEAPLRRALALRPGYPSAQNNLGRVMVWSGEYDEAVALLNAACSAEPDNPNFWNSLGVALRESGEVDEALGAFEKALALDPQLIDAHVNRAHAWLHFGDYDRGWREHEWRLQRPRFARRMAARCWTGEDIAGQTCLLWAEQGFGDAIQFIRYAPLVARRGARVLVECAEPLADIFDLVEGVAGTVRPGDHTAYDVHAALMSLPYILGAGPEAQPYLAPAATMPLADDGEYRVGLVWAGSAGHANDRNRSHSLAAFAPLVETVGSKAIFYALQMGDAAEQEGPAGMKLHRLGAAFNSFSDTAAAIAALDLVISVDTSVAHLAGAMGKDVWVILPQNPDWRWGRTGEDTPWYETVRLFRQAAGEDRSAVFERIARALGKRVGAAQI